MSWRHAKCRNVPVTPDDDIFFDEDPTHAVEFCNGIWDKKPCPILHECLLYALTNNCKEGVWGGRTEQMRGRIRRLGEWQQQD